MNENTEVINIFPCNWAAIQIARSMNICFESGFGTNRAVGFSRVEINSMMDIYNIDPGKKIDTLNKIIFIERIMINKLNS